MQSYVSNNMNTYITNWLNTNVNPVGSAVVVDKTLTIGGAAADAKITGDNIALLDIPKRLAHNLQIYINHDSSLKFDYIADYNGEGIKAYKISSPYDFNIIIRGKNSTYTNGNLDKKWSSICENFINTPYYAGPYALYIPDTYQLVLNLSQKEYKIIPRFNNSSTDVILFGANASVTFGLYGILWDEYVSNYGYRNLIDILDWKNNSDIISHYELQKTNVINLLNQSFKIADVRSGSYQTTSNISNITTSPSRGAYYIGYWPCSPNSYIEVLPLIKQDSDINLHFKYRYGLYDKNGDKIKQITLTAENVVKAEDNTYYIGVGVYAYDENDSLYDILSQYYDNTDEIVSINSNIVKGYNINELLKYFLPVQHKYLSIPLTEGKTGSLQLANHAIDSRWVGDMGFLDYIPIKPNEQLKVNIPLLSNPEYTYKYRYCIYDTNKSPIKQLNLVNYTTFSIPEDNAAYLSIGVYGQIKTSSMDAEEINLRSLLLSEYPEGVLTLTYNNRVKDNYITTEDATEIIEEKIKESVIEKTDIVGLNEGIKNKIIQAAKPINLTSWAYKTAIQPLCLLHFSDIHGDAIELSRISDFIEEYDSYIDDAICTGDLVAGRWRDDFSYWAQNSNGKILTTIGNHDVLAPDTGWDWSDRKTQLEQYNRYMLPFIENWGVHYTSGLTYYYKDYIEKTIRLIVLNPMLTDNDDTAQLSWFETVLTEALNNNLNVIVANHFPLAGGQKINSNFTTLDKDVSGTDANNYLQTTYQEKIKNFINAGGKFITHIIGHTHRDYITKGKDDYSNQLGLIIDCLNRDQCNQYSDLQRENGTLSQDLANLYFIDTTIKCIKIIRIGANMDHYLRPKNYLTINYETQQIISQY